MSFKLGDEYHSITQMVLQSIKLAMPIQVLVLVIMQLGIPAVAKGQRRRMCLFSPPSFTAGHWGEGHTVVALCPLAF